MIPKVMELLKRYQCLKKDPMNNNKETELKITHRNKQMHSKQKTITRLIMRILMIIIKRIFSFNNSPQNNHKQTNKQKNKTKQK